jgi:hypothetical protein
MSDPAVGEGIEDLLQGPDIVQHSLVRNSQLTELQKSELDADLTFEEFSNERIEHEISIRYRGVQ